MRLPAEKRNELNRATIRGAMHDVGIFIGALFAADKLFEIGSRFPVKLKPLIDKLGEIWFRSPVALIVLIVSAFIFVYLATIRVRDWRLMRSLERELARDEAESEISPDDVED
jgi:hypothetical protein